MGMNDFLNDFGLSGNVTGFDSPNPLINSNLAGGLGDVSNTVTQTPAQVNNGFGDFIGDLGGGLTNVLNYVDDNFDSISTVAGLFTNESPSPATVAQPVQPNKTDIQLNDAQANQYWIYGGIVLVLLLVLLFRR